nr:HtaA domain-containing protein [Leucobacter weissii]
MPAENGAACVVSGGTLTWGIKESFRSYISGSIANGSWETDDGADYETPNFLWSDPSGELDPETGIGTVSFTGSVHFTGHDGVLDLTLANPTIEFEGEGAAALLLDARSTDVAGELAVDAEQEWVGEVEVSGSSAPQNGALELQALPVALTNSGAKAFAGFYDAGESLDPLTLELSFDGCGDAATTAEPTTESPSDPAAEDPTAVEPAAAQVPWLPIIVGGAALLVIGLTLGLLIGGRGKRGAEKSQEKPIRER